MRAQPAAWLVVLLVAAGCAQRRSMPAHGDPAPRRSGARRASEKPPVPPGVRLVSFDAERDRAAAGAFLEPGWCVQLTAEIRDQAGKAVKGVPVIFRIDRRTGGGTVLPAELSHDTAITGPDGRARTVLVSSDREESCRVHATCGTVTLGARVVFARRRPSEFTVGLAVPRGPEREPWSPEAELDARIRGLVRALRRRDAAAAAVKREITAMGRAAVGPLLRMVYDQTRPRRDRRAAARVLAMVKDELVLARLIQALDDRRAAVRAGAEAGIFERGAARAGRSVRRAARLAGPFGRASAVRVLAAWGLPEDVALLAARAGADRDPLVRATAAWKLKAFQERAEARLALRAATADRSAFVRYSAAKASALVPAVSAGPHFSLLLPQSFRDAHPGVRAAVAGAARDARYFEPVLKLSHDRDVRVRRSAAASLGSMLAAPSPASRAGKRLHELLRDRDAVVSARAFRAMVRSGGDDAAHLMLRALRGDDAALAREALDSLERVYRVELGRPVLGARVSAGLAARWRDWSRECSDLVPCMRYWLAAERRDSRLRGEAVLELARSRDADGRARARAAILAAGMARSRDARVRAPACAALHVLGRPEGAKRLLADLSARDWPARYCAARSAAAVRRRDVALALARLLGDQTAAIRAAAHRSLVALRGSPGPAYDPEGDPAECRAARALWTKWAASLSMSSSRGPGGARR